METHKASIFAVSFFTLLQLSGQAIAAKQPSYDCYETVDNERRLKAVHIDLAVTQEKSGDIIHVDASKSDTVSKEIEYNWISSLFKHHDRKNPKNTIDPGSPGTYRQASFEIIDPACKSSGKALINIPSK